MAAPRRRSPFPLPPLRGRGALQHRGRPPRRPPLAAGTAAQTDNGEGEPGRAKPSPAVPSRAAPQAGRRGGVCLPAAAARSRRGLAGRGRGASQSPPPRRERGTRSCTPPPPRARAPRVSGSAGALCSSFPASRLRGSAALLLLGGGRGTVEGEHSPPRLPPPSLRAAADGGKVPSAPRGKLKMMDGGPGKAAACPTWSHTDGCGKGRSFPTRGSGSWGNAAVAGSGIVPPPRIWRVSPRVVLLPVYK